MVPKESNSSRKISQSFSNHFRNSSKRLMDHSFLLHLNCQRIASTGSGQWSKHFSKDTSSRHIRFMVASLGYKTCKVCQWKRVGWLQQIWKSCQFCPNTFVMDLILMAKAGVLHLNLQRTTHSLWLTSSMIAFVPKLARHKPPRRGKC